MYYRVIFIIFIKLKFKNFNSVAFAIVLDKAFLVTLGEWSILRNRCCRDHSQTKATDLIVAKKVFFLKMVSICHQLDSGKWQLLQFLHNIKVN
jgi:hypothetical protein